MKEIFLIIQDFPDYVVGDEGTIMSLYALNAHGRYLRKTPRILKYSVSNCGYQSVFLGSQLRGEAKRISVHRLVAKAFIPNPENKPNVNHRNGIKTDNKVSNLEWVTISENEIHAHKTGLKNFKGERAPYRKISFEIANLIRVSHQTLSQRQIAKNYNISQALVSLVVNNKIW